MRRYTATIGVLIAGLAAAAGYHHISRDISAQPIVQPAPAIPPPSTGDRLQVTDVYHLRSIGDVQLSPNGSSVAYAVVNSDKPGRPVHAGLGDESCQPGHRTVWAARAARRPRRAGRRMAGRSPTSEAMASASGCSSPAPMDHNRGSSRRSRAQTTHCHRLATSSPGRRMPGASRLCPPPPDPSRTPTAIRW